MHEKYIRDPYILPKTTLSQKPCFSKTLFEESLDVRKPLASVSRICEKGNIVQFGPCAVDNFIQSVATKEKVFMKKKGNSYVLEGDLCSTNPF